MRRTFTLATMAVALGLMACDSGKKSNSDKDSTTTDTQKVALVNAPVFNADSAYAFIEKQVSFGPRVPGTDAHSKCAAYLAGELTRFGAKVIIQDIKVRTYDNKNLSGKNIIGSYLPDNPNRILLCAHWDSRPYADWDADVANHRKPIDGADDGASGVGVLLEIARHLGTTSPQIGIDIVFFDIEDYGEPQDDQASDAQDAWGLGSQYWAKNPHIAGYTARYGILLDMVGAENATFFMEGYSTKYASSIVRKVWNTAQRLGYERYFILQDANPITDDHYYINEYAGIPTIDIIHQSKSSKTGFAPHWHTIGDNMDIINRETLQAVGQTVMQQIFSEK